MKTLDTMLQDLREDSARQLRTGDDPRFLKRAVRVKALPGSIFQEYNRHSRTAWFHTESSGEWTATAGMTHTQRVQLTGLPEIMKQPGMTPMKAARLATTEGDIRVFCTCPSYKFHGFQYIDTQRDAAIRAENRFPEVRNPHLRGTVCKHLLKVLQVLPFNAPKIAHELAVKRDRWTGMVVEDADRALLAEAVLRGYADLILITDPDLFMAYEQEDSKFSSTQVNFPDPEAGYVRAYAAGIPDEGLAEDGREDEVHITVKYGLHTADPEAVRKAVSGFGPVTATLGRVTLFNTNPDFDVVKIDVNSGGLAKLNKIIAGCTACTDTHPVYHPHCTLAYVKKGLGEEYVGDPSFEGMKIEFTQIVFSGKDHKDTVIPLGRQKPVEAFEAATMPRLGKIPPAGWWTGEKILPLTDAHDVHTEVIQDYVRQHPREALAMGYDGDDSEEAMLRLALGAGWVRYVLPGDNRFGLGRMGPVAVTAQTRQGAQDFIEVLVAGGTIKPTDMIYADVIRGMSFQGPAKEIMESSKSTA